DSAMPARRRAQTYRPGEVTGAFRLLILISLTGPWLLPQGLGDGDRDRGHQVGVSGPGGTGEPGRAGRAHGDDEAPVGQRPGEPGGRVGVLPAVRPRGEDV